MQNHCEGDNDSRWRLADCLDSLAQCPDFPETCRAARNQSTECLLRV